MMKPTIGVDFFSRKIQHLDGVQYRLQFWDTAGAERFRLLLPSYIRDAACIVIVFDATSQFLDIIDPNYAQYVKLWVSLVENYIDGDSPIMLCANTIDQAKFLFKYFRNADKIEAFLSSLLEQNKVPIVLFSAKVGGGQAQFMKLIVDTANQYENRLKNKRKNNPFWVV